MSIAVGRAIKICLRIAAELRARHPRLALVIRYGAVQPGTEAHALQLELDALQCVAAALALDTPPPLADLRRVEAILQREGLMLPHGISLPGHVPSTVRSPISGARSR